jgi:hypothetical protein
MKIQIAMNQKKKMNMPQISSANVTDGSLPCSVADVLRRRAALAPPHLMIASWQTRLTRSITRFG